MKLAITLRENIGNFGWSILRTRLGEAISLALNHPDAARPESGRLS